MVILVRGWLVLDLTDSAFLVTTTQAVSMLPTLVLPPFAGVLADRVSRKLILVVNEIANLGFLALLIGLLFTGVIQVWHVFAIGFLNGITFALMMPARAAVVPDVVRVPRDIPNAMALWGSIFSYGQIIGPAIAGYLLSIDPDQLGWGFIGCAAVLIPSLLFLIPLHVSATVLDSGDQAPERPSVFDSFMDGLRSIRTSRFLMGLMYLSLVFSVFCMPYQSLLPVFARDVLVTGTRGLGILGASAGIGSILGSFVMAVYSVPQQMKGWTVLGTVLFGPLTFLFALSTMFSVSVALVFGLGFLTQLFMTGSMTLVQVTVPASVRGRIFGVRYLIMGFGSIGMIILGFGAQLWGPPLAVSVMGLMALIATIGLLVRFPEVRTQNLDLGPLA
jgi:MFS family permease